MSIDELLHITDTAWLNHTGVYTPGTKELSALTYGREIDVQLAVGPQLADAR